jgi:predicted transposase YdaD
LEQLYNLQQNLAVNQNIDKDDRELVMRLAPLYQQDRELAKQEGREEGREEGEQRLIIPQLNRRFGEIDASLIARIRGLSIEQLELLGDALLDFTATSDLVTWLNQ